MALVKEPTEAKSGSTSQPRRFKRVRLDQQHAMPAVRLTREDLRHPTSSNSLPNDERARRTISPLRMNQRPKLGSGKPTASVVVWVFVILVLAGSFT